MTVDEELKWFRENTKRIEQKKAQFKAIYEKISSFEINTFSDVNEFASYLYKIADSSLRIILEWHDRNKCTWDECLKDYDNHSKQVTGDFEVHVFWDYTDAILSKIAEKLNLCEKIFGSCQMLFHNLRNEEDAKSPHMYYMSGEEEARECNRQFRSMMDDNDAWENID